MVFLLNHIRFLTSRTDEWINVSSPRLRPYSSPSKPPTPTAELAASEPSTSEPIKEAVKVEEKTKKPDKH